jgi:exopolyphosphatase/guanosine-5'-triphosphate,3'-diphosphate pyrophosphatase
MPQFLRPENREGTVAAIDLGSNALRAIIARPINGHIRVLKEVRVPLRLGEDVFTTGTISPTKIAATEESFILLLHLFTEHEVQDVRAVATSAMRDASNGLSTTDRIEQFTGIKLETISGIEEARLIHRAVGTEIDLGRKNALLLDVGGGSTEITLLQRGELLASMSFDIGTVRLLNASREMLDDKIDKETAKILRFVRRHFKLKDIDIVAGTGGNLRRIGKIRRKVLGKSSEECSYSEVAHMAQTLFSMGLIERVRALELEPDRADVILPATMLVESLMRQLGAKKILLPKVGLKEGLILDMLGKKKRKFLIRHD